MNNMTALLNKVERRLGTNQLHLPDYLSKPTWKNIIIEDTIPTFSRYLPLTMRVEIDTHDTTKDGYCLIDKDLPDDIKILGIRDIDWSTFGMNGTGFQGGVGYGAYDFFSCGCGLDSIMELQMRADTLSLFNNGIYPEFVYPNKVRFMNSTGANITDISSTIPIIIFIEHNPNLGTIAPTKMEIFENLATADIASFLYEQLKYYDGLDTVFANVDIKLDSIKDRADRRESIIEELKDGYVSAANEGQPLMITI